MSEVDLSPLRLLSPIRVQREPAPSNVWDWQDYLSWKNVIWKLIGKVADKTVRARFLESPPEYVVADNLRWLDTIIWLTRGVRVESRVFLAERLLSRFKALRCAHGTRTADMNSFYSEGLLPLDPGVVAGQARQIFLGGRYPELCAHDLESAISAVDTDLRSGRVFFACDERRLVEECGHYLLYGSEYLVSVAGRLRNSRNYQQELKKHGQPTVFVCDVPLSLMDYSTMLEFSGTALAAVFQELLDGEAIAPDGGGFAIDSPCLPNASSGTITR